MSRFADRRTATAELSTWASPCGFCGWTTCGYSYSPARARWVADPDSRCTEGRNLDRARLGAEVDQDALSRAVDVDPDTLHSEALPVDYLVPDPDADCWARRPSCPPLSRAWREPWPSFSLNDHARAYPDTVSALPCEQLCLAAHSDEAYTLDVACDVYHPPRVRVSGRTRTARADWGGVLVYTAPNGVRYHA